MKHIELNGANWVTIADFYDALLPAIGAPAWHGRNLDALNDTIGGDDINAVHLPYTIRITGWAGMSKEAQSIVSRFADLVRDRKADSLAIDLVIDKNSN